MQVTKFSMKIAIHVNCRGYYSSRGSAEGGAMATLILGIYLVSYPHGTQFYVIQAPRPPLGCALTQMSKLGWGVFNGP